MRKVTQVFCLERLASGDTITAKTLLANMVAVSFHPHPPSLPSCSASSQSCLMSTVGCSSEVPHSWTLQDLCELFTYGNGRRNRCFHANELSLRCLQGSQRIDFTQRHLQGWGILPSGAVMNTNPEEKSGTGVYCSDCIHWRQKTGLANL